MNTPEHFPRAIRGAFVNVYEVSRVYSGPEEGGRYHDEWQCVASYRVRGSVNSDKAVQALNRYRVQYGFTPSSAKRFQMRNRIRFIPGYGYASNNGRLPGNRRTERAQRSYSEIGQCDKTLISLESVRGSDGDNYCAYE